MYVILIAIVIIFTNNINLASANYCDTKVFIDSTSVDDTSLLKCKHSLIHLTHSCTV